MRRVLSSIGVGNATVDTVLPRTELHPGETVEGTVELHGGDSTQEIDGVYFSLESRVESEDEVERRQLAEHELERSIELEPGDERELPVDFRIPRYAPLARGDAEVWIETGLDIDWARDPTDEDRLRVVPDERTAALFDAIEDLGFAYRYSELVDTPYLDDRPFAQEFDFRPTTDEFAERLDELEVTAMPRRDDLRVFVEFDQRDPVAEEHDLDFDEMETAITFERADADEIRSRLRSAIEHYG